MADRPLAAALAVTLALGVVLVPTAGCVGSGGDTLTTSPDYAHPDPPERLTPSSARRVALENEAAVLHDRGVDGNPGPDVGADGPSAVARDLGGAVYVAVAYPYAADDAAAVSRASYLVTTDAVRRFDPDAHATDVETFQGTPAIADPVDVRLLDAADGGAVSLSLTYTDEPHTVLADRLAVGAEGRTLRDVAGRVGTYRATAEVDGSVATSAVSLGRDAGGALVVVVDRNESVHVFRVHALG